MAKIVVVGSLNMDLVAVAPRIPVAGETIMGAKFFTAPGGKGANQAYAAAKLGGSAAMLGRVGDDDFGKTMRSDLEQAGCNVSAVRVVANCRSGVALIAVADDGANSIVVVPGANHRFGPADINADASTLEGASILLLQLESPTETVIAAARSARERGIRVILDPSPAPSALPGILLQNTDILTPNETEAAILAGFPPRSLSSHEAGMIARRLQEMGAPVVVMKLGAQGCLLADQGESITIGAPRMNVVDTTAAGDVFNAALAVALSEGKDLKDACRFAVYAGSLSVIRLGAQGSVPARSEVDEFLRG